MIVPTLILNQTVVPPPDGKIYGIHTATRQWLAAYIRHLQPQEIRYRAQNAEQEQTVAQLAGPIPMKKAQGPNDIEHCAFYTQLPDADQFWLRQAQSPRQYSICGLNHSLSGGHIYAQLRDLFLAPTQDWDALVCSSRASHAVISAYMDGWAEYLAARGGGDVAALLRPRLQLPVIPMGADCVMWATPDAEGLGKTLRGQLNIATDDIVVLFLGRLNFSSKAHPWPMLQALEDAQVQSGKTVHLIQAGWYPSPAFAQMADELGAALAPAVKLHTLPASTDVERRAAYAAADIFISLADNIQESFGLTLVEAMACGLPVVASDWDGYRDTVVHGETGFLVPTLIAPPGSGADIGLAHGLGARVYNRYLVDVGQATAVSAHAVRDALMRLIGDADLRRRMGEAGRRRAAAYFDWRVIVGQHRDLWGELDARRHHAEAAPSVPNPYYPDPFALFRSFASGILRPGTLLTLDDNWQNILKIAEASPTMRSSEDMLIGGADIALLLGKIQTQPGIATAKLIEGVSNRAYALRSVMWLIKAGIVVPTIEGF